MILILTLILSHFRLFGDVMVSRDNFKIGKGSFLHFVWSNEIETMEL